MAAVKNRAEGIGNILPRNRRRGTMNRLEHRNVSGTQIAARGHPQAALQSRSKIGDDVAEHVVGDDDIEPARIAHHLHAERVHVHVLRLDLRILGSHLLEHSLP